MKNVMALLLTFTSLAAAGQNHFLGIKAGPNWTTVTSSLFANGNKYRTGVAGGVTYEYLAKKHFSVSADLLYNQRGFRDDFAYTFVSGVSVSEVSVVKFNYDYLSLPIKVGFSSGDKLYSFANVGVVPSWIVSAKTYSPYFDNNGVFTSSQPTDATSRVANFDLAGLLEIGVGYKIKDRYRAFSSFTYQRSITTITNADYFANATIRHSGMALSAGVKYALTK